MYKNQFDKEFSSNVNYNSFLFYGACDYLVQKYSDDVSLRLANGDDINKIYFDEYNFKDCESYLSQSSLFSANNVLLIKTAKKIPKKELDQLVAMCNTNPDSSLIISCIGTIDFKSMAKSFTKKTNSAELRFYQPTDQEAVNTLKELAKVKNVDCGFGELQYLYNMHQKDLSLCANDLNKLAILDVQITSNIINTQCFGMGAVSLDDFFYKLFMGNSINKDLYMLLEEGMNEVHLVTQTTGFIKQLFSINSYIKINGQLNVIEIWGYPLPEPIAKKRANVASKFNKDDFLRMFNYFQNLELELKTKNTLDKNSYTQACFRNFSATLR